MRRADRFALIRKLADRLAQHDFPWEDMELALREFGFSTPLSGNFSKREYALTQLEAGTDDALVELDETLFGGPSRELLDPADLPWKAGAFRLFISHTHPHATLAGEMATIFDGWRIHAFVAHKDIEPTREWERVIEAALDSCHALIALITPDFLSSKWCDQEVGYCLHRRVPIVPIKLGRDPHGFMGKYQAATTSYPDRAPWVADAVFRPLVHRSAISTMMAAPDVHRYAASTNVDGAQVNFGLLRDVPAEAWTPELVELAERATGENREIVNATVLEPETKPMPEAATELLAPIRERLGMNVPQVPHSHDDIPF